MVLRNVEVCDRLLSRALRLSSDHDLIKAEFKDAWGLPILVLALGSHRSGKVTLAEASSLGSLGQLD